MSLFTSPGKVAETKTSLPVELSFGFYVRGWTLYFLEYVPGFLLLGGLALLARRMARGGNDSYCFLFAILLGMLFRHLCGVHASFEPGTRLYEIFWKAGIILLGSQMGLRSFREVGLTGFGLAGFEVIFTIALTLFLTRLLKIPAPLRYLLAVGLGICGVSAVVALSATLRTDEEDTAYAVSVILLFGLLTLSFFPLIGWWLHLTGPDFGSWAGLSVDNTAEAVATGFVYSETAGHYATITKLCRNLFLDFALLYFVQRAVREKLQGVAKVSFRMIWEHFPKFAIGLLVLSALATFHFWEPEALSDLNHLYRWAFLFGFAGVGLRTDLGRLRRRGLKPLGLAFGIQSLTAILMLVCVLLFLH